MKKHISQKKKSIPQIFEKKKRRNIKKHDRGRNLKYQRNLSKKYHGNNITGIIPEI